MKRIYIISYTVLQTNVLRIKSVRNNGFNHSQPEVLFRS